MALYGIETDDRERFVRLLEVDKAYPAWPEGIGPIEAAPAPTPEPEPEPIPEPAEPEPVPEPLPGEVPTDGAYPPALRTDGSLIVQASTGAPVHLRGVNLFDTRSCNACTYDSTPEQALEEAKRRISFAREIGANFVRLCLASHAQANGRRDGMWQGPEHDPVYLESIAELVRHAGEVGLYCLVSLWQDETFRQVTAEETNHLWTDSAGVVHVQAEQAPQGFPGVDTVFRWRLLADRLKVFPHAIFGLCNEPTMNAPPAGWVFQGDAADDVFVRAGMQAAIDAIRATGAENLISCPGLGQWARRIEPFVRLPLQGHNLVYECHPYNAAHLFEAQWVQPSLRIPVVIGEFGPAMGMGEADCAQLIQRANDLGVSWAAWSLHHRCDAPEQTADMLVDNSSNGCGRGMELVLTPWGATVQAALRG